MEKQVVISVDLIDPNPYQPRKQEDPAVVAEIADSIKHNGLLQVPPARRVNGRVQLAFGHTRLAAFKLNGETSMPLIIRDLDDLQMFELGVAENIKRKDLNPMELAEAMRSYMQTFGKNSIETGEFFGVSEETVRATIRFTNLAPLAQDKLRSGEINVTTARELMTAQRLVGESGVTEVLECLGQDEDGVYDSPQEAIQDVIRESPDLREMPYNLTWQEEKKFPRKHLTPLNRKLVAELLDVEAGDVARKELLDQIMQLLASGMEITDAQFPSFLPGQLEKVRVLANPPACTSCPFHAIFDNDHYCAMKVCYERKERAWSQAEVEKLWKSLGIPLYVNEATDGRAVELSRWNDADQKLFKERHADLRLKPTTRSVWNNFDGLPNNVILIAVGKTAEKRLAVHEKSVQKEQTEKVNREQEFKIRELRQDHVARFSWDVAAPIFQSLLDGLTNASFLIFLCDSAIYEGADYPHGVDDQEEQLARVRKAKKAEALKHTRRLIMQEVLYRAMGWNYDQYRGHKQPIVVWAKQAQKYAQEWGLKLPKTWLQSAEAAQKELDKAVKELSNG